MFVPQSIQTQVELEKLQDVKLNIINPKSSDAVIGPKQDSISAAFQISSNTFGMDWKELMNTVMYVNNIDSSKLVIEKNKKYMGNEIFSTLMPPSFNFITMDDSGNKIFDINNGRISKGIFNKGALRQTTVMLWDRLGPETSRDFINNVQRVGNYYLMNDGLTLGYGDGLISDDLKFKLSTLIEAKKLEIDTLITQMENNPESMDVKLFEDVLSSSLDEPSTNIGKLAFDSLKSNNGYYTMVKSSAKGTVKNVGEVLAAKCQVKLQNVGRVPRKVNNRTLPHFTQFDDSAIGRGFITRSFTDGQMPSEFFFEVLTGREGLIDTAIKSVTGDTPIVVLEDDITKTVLIGDWIDNMLENNKDKVEKYEEREMELLRLSNKIYIPTADENGNVSWGEISAITRHDPGKELYEIKTHGGRRVIVTESKSLLIWNESSNKFEMKSTPEVKLGDFVPVTMNLPKPPVMNLSDEFNKLLCGYESDIQTYIQNNCKTYERNEYNYITCNTIDNIVMLLNRLNIYSEYINETTIRYTLDNTNRTCNDVVLDSIIEINIIDVKKYPKVYDLTIPSTLNFGLANGLHVVDTADSGYTQRKLIKALEDMMINNDFTVRSSNNVLVQYVYGDSGVNTIKQRKQKLNFITYNNQTLMEKLCFSKDHLQDISKSTKQDLKTLEKFNNEVYDYIKDMRDQLRIIQEKAMVNFLFVTSEYFLPVDFTIILSNMKPVGNTPLTPQYVMEQIQYILRPEVTKLLCMPKKHLQDNRSIKYKDQFKYKTLFECALLEFMSPKKCIVDYKLDKEGFDNMVKDVISAYNKALVEAGDMIGCTAGQSMGESLSQMSTRKNTKIALFKTNKKDNIQILKNIQIGELVDNLLNKYPKLVKSTGYTDSVEIEIPEHLDYLVPSVDNSGKVDWRRISHFSRHPANGQLVKITTATGREITTTPNHSHLMKSKTGIEPMPAEKLKVGERVPVCRKLDMINDYIDWTFETDKGEIIKMDLDNITGWFFGAYLAEGHLHANTIILTNISDYYHKNSISFANKYNLKHHRKEKKGEYGDGAENHINSKFFANHIDEYYKKGSYNKVIPDYVFDSNKPFISALLRGYFDGDGNVDDSRNCIRCGSRSKQLIEGIGQLLMYFGIMSSFYEESKVEQVKDENGNMVDKVKILYCLSVLMKDIPLFEKYIGSDFADKKQKMVNITKDIQINSDLVGKTNDKIDMIPTVMSEYVATCGEKLGMEGQSRTYGIFHRNNKDIGRPHLKKIINKFESICDEVARTGEFLDKDKKGKPKYRVPHNKDISTELKYLKEAVESDVLWDKIEKIEYIDDPKEYVYDFTVPGNQTFMISNGIMTHNTLNSVDWWEQIRVKQNKNDIVKCIGEYIDDIIDSSKNIEHYENETEYVDISNNNVMIQSVNEDGNIKWKKILAVTRHLPNKDCNDSKLVKITTKTGRSVRATKAKSFLVRENNKLVPIEGSRINVGDKLPIQLNNCDLVKYNYSDYYGNDLYTKYKNNKLSDNELTILLNSSDNFVNVFIDNYLQDNDNIQDNLIFELLANVNRNINGDTLNDVFFDEIISIEEVDSSHPKVYDFTVEDTKNFNMLGGICMRDTFHSSGSGSAGMQGVPRLKELIGCTPNIKQPITIIALQPEVRNNKIMVDNIASYIRYITVEDITTKTEIIYDPEPNGKNGYGKLDNVDNIFFVDKSKAMQKQSGAEIAPWLLRIFLNREKMIEKDVNMLYIKTRFVNFWNETYTDNKKISKEEKDVLSAINHVGICTNDDNSNQPIIHIRFDLNTISMDLLNNLNNIIINNFKLKGMRDIKDIDKIPEDIKIIYDEEGNIKQEKQFTIFTKGINLLDIRKIKGININNSYCNSITEIYEKFGIEAVRSALIKEITGVYMNGGHTINYQHFAMLVDMMTNTGVLTSIDRHGMNRLDTDPLSRVSFERQVDELLQAAMFSKTDHMRSVSSRIMAGKCFKGGTCYNDIIFDNEMLENSEYIDISEDKQREFNKSIKKFEENSMINDIIKKKKVKVFIP